MTLPNASAGTPATPAEPLPGLEVLPFHFSGMLAPAAGTPVLVGVVGSGQLEVLAEPDARQSGCQIEVRTSARGFGPIWAAVLRDFHARTPFGGLRLTLNDMGATPAVVSLRLAQVAAALQQERAA